MGSPFRALVQQLKLLLFLSLFSLQTKAQLFNFKSNATSITRDRNLARKCNIFRGKWVYYSSYPLYDFSTCPFIDPQFNCQKYGRPDRSYLKYRWQPLTYSLPRFNALTFLEKWRGKKIMFVGDSLSLNQWESLSCMIHAWIPNSRTSLYREDGVASLTFKDYGVQLWLYRTPYLVDLVNDGNRRVLKLDSMKNGDAWTCSSSTRGTGGPTPEEHNHTTKQWSKILPNDHEMTIFVSLCRWDYLEDGGKVFKDMNRLIAYYKGLTTWGRWVDLNVDPWKTRVFFLGISPTHNEGRDWNKPSRTCMGETMPYLGVRYPARAPLAWVVVNKVLSRIRKPVNFLDATSLSQLRKDGHPSAYGEHGGNDCSHWCLPGLPNTWNELLYAALFG